MKASIIIVTWNGKQHLPDCLESLRSQTFHDFEVIVVDNGSTDGTLEYLRTHHPWVRVVQLPENTGFAHGNNSGFSHSSGDYIVTLNNDTMAEPGWLGELVAVADAHPEAGMVACRICNFTDRDQIDSLGFTGLPGRHVPRGLSLAAIFGARHEPGGRNPFPFGLRGPLPAFDDRPDRLL